MAEGRRLRDLGEVVDCEHKTAPPAQPGHEYAYSVGTPALRGADIDFEESKPVDEDTYRAWSRRAELKRGDVILAREAPVGGVGFVDGTRKVCLGQRTVLVRANPAVLDSRFLFYALQSPQVQTWMKDRSSGSTVAHINVSDVRDLPLPLLPDLPEQRRIAEALAAFDDLVAKNIQLIDSLVEMSDAIYVSSTVDGAVSSTVGEIAVFENNKRVPLSAKERLGNPGKYPYYGATGQMDSVGGFLFDGERVLVGEDGSVVRPDGTAIVQHVTGQYWVNNHAHVLSGGTISTALLRFVLRNTNVSTVITGAVQAKLSMGSLKSVPVLLPASDMVDKRIQTLTAAEVALRREVNDLRRAREALLPLLLSGRVSVPEVAA
jgi:type I restriction enzyme S subunit